MVDSAKKREFPKVPPLPLLNPPNTDRGAHATSFYHREMLRFDTPSFLCANERLLLLTQAAELLQNVMSIESLADAKVWRLPSPSA